MINFDQIPKILINLKKREDRLALAKKEMEFMNWEFDVFEAFDTNSYIGCALSHVEIAKKFLNSNDDYLMVLEDDVFFMPYSKEVLKNCEIELNKLNWDFFHLGPSLHRPINAFSQNLLDLTNVPPKDIERHRGIYATQGFVITKKSAEMIINWDTNKYIVNSHRMSPIDQYFNDVVYPNTISFSPSLPVALQRNNFSNINKTYDNNYYLISYNWNVYSPNKLDTKYFNQEYSENEKYNKS